MTSTESAEQLKQAEVHRSRLHVALIDSSPDIADRRSRSGQLPWGATRDPAGLVFCVVPVQSDDFEQHATTWT